MDWTEQRVTATVRYKFIVGEEAIRRAYAKYKQEQGMSNEIKAMRKALSQGVQGAGVREVIDAEIEDAIKNGPQEQGGAWGVKGDNFFVISESVKRLPAGYYDTCLSDQLGPYLSKREIKLDRFYRFTESDQDKLISRIGHFWDSSEKYKSLGFAHKRGLLLHGPPGGGKTSLIIKACDEAIENQDAVVFLPLNNGNGIDVNLIVVNLARLKSIEPDRKVIVVLEDLEGMNTNRNDTSPLLSLLDGENSFNNCLFIGTTNYPEMLDKRIIRRPRRFDDVVEVKYPSEGVREQYFKIVLGEHGSDEAEIRRYVEGSDAWGFAGIAELVIATKCLDVPFEEACAKINDLYNKKLPTSESYDKKSRLGLAG